MSCLIINGASRNNSVTNKVAQYISYRIDSIVISNIHGEISGCTGCKSCFNGNTCIIKDSYSDILKQIQKFDCIIVISPIYGFSMCSKARAMVERMSPQLEKINSIYLLTISGSHGYRGGDDLVTESFRRMCEYSSNSLCGYCNLITDDKCFEEIDISIIDKFIKEVYHGIKKSR